jgi:sulfide:quinone oxidoreductase
MRIVVLGAGFGGLELTTRLSEELGDEHEVVLIDQGEGFIFGFSKLDVMFGRALPHSVVHPYRDLVKPGVHFVRASVRSIDPVAKRVGTDAGDFDADILVVALGADLHPDDTPGLLEGGHEFYTVPGAFALRDVLAEFPGGRVIVAVTSTPFKCPPAPSECALLLHDHLVARGVRRDCEIEFVIPFGTPVPPSPDTSAALIEAFAERGIAFLPGRTPVALDTTNRVVTLDDGSERSYDLFFGVPKHRAPDVVIESGMSDDGYIPVAPATLETRYPGVYACGDVATVGVPKAGVFAEGAARVVARELVAKLRGDQSPAAYDGRGSCYIEFGAGRVGRVDVDFFSGPKPIGTYQAPSTALVAEKEQFGASRRARWFGL